MSVLTFAGRSIRTLDASTLVGVVADGVTVGTSVTDASGSGDAYQLVPGGGANQARFSANGFSTGVPSIQMDGTGGLYLTTSFASTVGSGVDHSITFGANVNLTSVTGLTSHFVAVSSSTSQNPFWFFGAGSANAWRIGRRSDAGVTTRSATAGVTATGQTRLIATFDGATGLGEVWLNGVSLGGAINIADATSLTLNLLCWGCQYRPTASPAIAGGMIGYLHRAFAVNGKLNSGEIATADAWLSELVQAPAVITMGAPRWAILGSSTADGAGGLVNPTVNSWPGVLTTRYGAAAYRATSSAGIETWETLPAGDARPAWAPPTISTHDINTCLAANPKVLLYQIQSDFGQIATYQAGGYAGDVWSYPDDHLIPMMTRIKGLCDAAKCELRMVPLPQVSPTVTSDDHLIAMIHWGRKLRAAFGHIFVDTLPILSLDRANANTAVFITANAHPDIPGQLLLANVFEQYAKTAQINVPKFFATNVEGFPILDGASVILTPGTVAYNPGTALNGASVTLTPGTVAGLGSVINGVSVTLTPGSVVYAPPVSFEGEFSATLGKRMAVSAMLQRRPRAVIGS